MFSVETVQNNFCKEHKDQCQAIWEGGDGSGCNWWSQSYIHRH